MSAPAQIGDQVGIFILDKSLSNGKGGMSEVYLARDRERPLLKVALKMQRNREEDWAVYQDLLRQEALILQQIRHPHIVRIFPLPIQDNSIRYSLRHTPPEGPAAWYYAMEYIGGASLEMFLRTQVKTEAESERHFRFEWGIELFYQILTAVQYLHHKGLAHCDLKPENILFRRPPDPFELPAPVLIDFGSATTKNELRHLTASLGYSPPEVILALERKDIPLNRIKINPQKIDIWALGALLYEIVTGQPLIDRSRKDLTTTLIRGKLEYASIHSLRPEASGSLDKLLRVMLRRDPLKRPDIDQIIQAIEEKISSVRAPRIYHAPAEEHS